MKKRKGKIRKSVIDSAKLAESGETRDIVACFVGVSHDTLKKEENTMANFPTVNKGRALDHIAGFLGVDRKTLSKAEEIVTAAEQEPEL